MAQSFSLRTLCLRIGKYAIVVRENVMIESVRLMC